MVAVSEAGWMDGLRRSVALSREADRMESTVSRLGIATTRCTRDACLLIAAAGADAVRTALVCGASGPLIDEVRRVTSALARRVLDGAAGDGAGRVRLLGAAYDAVQAEVNRVLRERFL